MQKCIYSNCGNVQNYCIYYSFEAAKEREYFRVYVVHSGVRSQHFVTISREFHEKLKFNTIYNIIRFLGRLRPFRYSLRRNNVRFF